jgi:Secretin and TonB N terminus short domain/TonB C terminal
MVGRGAARGTMQAINPSDPARLRGLAAALCLGLCIGASAVGAAARAPIDFDIPAQPLDRAFAAVGAASGLQIFYETALTDGRRSAEVRGQLEPETALRLLLRGSGLTARLIAAGTISITPGREEEEAAAVAVQRQVKHAYLPYYGYLQAGVMTALCADPRTRPGRYHIALQYWIDATGRIAEVKLIGTSGSAARDTAIIAALQGVALPPPGAMPQPVTMAVEPTGPSDPVACPAETP